MRRATWAILLFAAAGPFLAGSARAEDPWVVYEGGTGLGKGKQIVLISGDEEYRSEEALPQLGKILAKHHGFRCTVLFAVDKDGTINPQRTDNIPGLEALKTADLMIIFTRFRKLPPEQMKWIDEYLQTGKPIIGMRTATHAFADRGHGGFGRQVLGENWVNHHGHHGKESTRGLIAPGEETHPVLKGIKSGDVWGPTDVYTVNLPLPGDSKPLILGQVLQGMKPDDQPVEGKKNDPMMPVAWVKTFTPSEGESKGKPARVFTTTMGASQDLQSEGLRRLLVNAVYWTMGMESMIPDKTNVEIVGEYKPRPFGFGTHEKGKKPSDYAMK